MTLSDSALPGAGPLAAFRSSDFRLFQLGKLLATLALQMQGVAVGWQVYQLTGSALDLGYVGLAQFAPALLMSVVSGHVADHFERRRILAFCHGLHCVCALLLYLSTRSASPSLPHIYALLILVGLARAFQGPAASALLPSLVPTAHFPNAVAWSSSSWQVAVIGGPALGGILYGIGDAKLVYGVTMSLQALTVLFYSSIKARVTPPRAHETSRELTAGLRFIWHRPIILGAISLDLFAVLFGGAVALLPIFARDILQTGPQGLGLLRSAPAVGALLTGVVLAYRPLRGRAGLAMFAGVLLYGLATIVFGLSRSFTLSLLALMLTGAADMVSVFVRQSLVQLRTPDAMRGRVAAVNHVFVGASNELGEFESGLAASVLGATSAVVLGGLATCAVVVVWALLFPSLRKVDRLDVESA